MFSASKKHSAIRAGVACASLAIALTLAGCTGNGAATESAQGGRATATPTPSIAHDGRTVLPAPSATACKVLSPEAIRKALGPLASDLQGAQPSAVQDTAGVKKDSCIYPLDASGLTTNALITEVTTYPSRESLAADDPFKLMTAPEDVPGLGERAMFAVNRLSGTSEYVLTVVAGVRATRVLVALPSSSSQWDKAKGREVLESLAGLISF